MTEKEIDKEIAGYNKKISKIDEKEAKGEELSNTDIRKRNAFREEIEKFELMKRQVNATKKPSNTTTTAPTATPTKPVTSTATTTKPVTKPTAKPTATSSTEKGLEKVEEKAQDVADELNNDELNAKKTEDAKSAAEGAKNRAAQIDDNREENAPFWFWKEAQEMAPTDKAKRGFLIANHILNRFGTAFHNIGVAFQNNGGSGGGQMREHGGSFIDQYRQNKLEQVLANRKARQNNLLQQQIDALVAIGVSENEARAIQNRLRNSSFWNKYNRLTNEQQVYIQGLLYNDTKGKINDAALGNFIDQLMEGKNVSLEQAAVNMMAAEGIDNIDEIKSGAKAIGDKVIKWLNWDKPGQ